MAITTEIDLTLESDFAAEYDRNLLPVRARPSRENFWGENTIRINGRIIDLDRCYEFDFGISFLSYFFDTESKARLYDWILNFYTELFGLSLRLSKMWEKFDPWAMYWFMDGMICDRCGKELNLITRKYSLCDRCEAVCINYMIIN